MHESGENYLEAILVLRQKYGYVRAIDVANHLGFSKPSVSRAMSILKDGGYIEVEHSGNILLTDLGKQKAEDVYSKHVALTKFLNEILGVSMENAEADACRIEHIISEETYGKILEFIDKKGK